MLLTAFCIVAAVSFLLLFTLWKKSSTTNMVFKFAWLMMAVWAILCSLQQLGVLKQ